MKLINEEKVIHIDNIISKINEIFNQNKWKKIVSSSSSLVNNKNDENNKMLSNSNSNSNTYSNNKYNYPFDKFTINYNYNMNTIDVLIPVVNGDLLYKTTSYFM